MSLLLKWMFANRFPCQLHTMAFTFPLTIAILAFLTLAPVQATNDLQCRMGDRTCLTSLPDFPSLPSLTLRNQNPSLCVRCIRDKTVCPKGCKSPPRCVRNWGSCRNANLRCCRGWKCVKRGHGRRCVPN